jgi:hypothetical protein
MRPVNAALLFAAGLLVATGLMVFDEILTLAIYCGCSYKIPLLGTFQLYDAEGFAWTLILLGISLILLESFIKTRDLLALEKECLNLTSPSLPAGSVPADTSSATADA